MHSDSRSIVCPIQGQKNDDGAVLLDAAKLPIYRTRRLGAIEWMDACCSTTLLEASLTWPSSSSHRKADGLAARIVDIVALSRLEKENGRESG